MIDSIEPLLRTAPFGDTQRQKEEVLTPLLNELTEWHASRCEPYARLLRLMWPEYRRAADLTAIPWLPVGLFKSHRLASVPDSEVFKTLTSSGTTGQQVSRIILDRATARRQTFALASIMGSVLGPSRLPMILVESKNIIKDRLSFSARGAGLLGMMNFGRDHFFALDDDMRLDVDGLEGFLRNHGSRPFAIFGFTWMVWKYLYREIESRGLDLSQGILIHSGGWKKLLEEQISNSAFKQHWERATGLRRIYNFYGMVEQVGSVFLEGDDGFLYAPRFADVIVRDPRTWQALPDGETGVVQVLSVIPLSYPGHSILTEDLGLIHGRDDSDAGRGGKRFSIIGRLPKAELRGCSDTHAFSTAA